MSIKLQSIPIGFLTVPFASLSLEEVAQFGGENGFDYLEVAAWPERTSRTEGEASYVANHLGNLADFTQKRADDINGKIKNAGMKGISSLAFYENMLTSDVEERAFYHDHLKKVINGAQLLGVELVGIFPGRNQSISVDESLNEYGKLFPETVKYARDHNVQLMFENCPMEGWIEGKRTGNIASYPKNWRIIFEMTPEMGFNIDPSHMIWQQIDYEKAVREFGDQIVHAHGKDAKLLDNYDTGTFGDDWPKKDWGAGLYKHAVPGQGDVNWGKFTAVLREIGFKGILSVELEAPEYKPREDIKLSKTGMIISRQNLLPFCMS